MFHYEDLGPRDYHIDTDIVHDGQPQAVICYSSREPEYVKIADDLARHIHMLTGRWIPARDAERVAADGLLEANNVIALGNLKTSSFIETLYWEWYTLLDLWYPGKGGYVIRTLHDPYGTGRNVILLGGSDTAGVREAAKIFADMLEPELGNLSIGRIMDIKLGEGHEMPAVGEWCDPRLRPFNPDLNLPLGYTEMSRWGLIYYYSGDEEAARKFRELALGETALADNHYSAHMHTIIWDLIEESPIFSDNERIQITGRIKDYAQSIDGTAGLHMLEEYPQDEMLIDRHRAMQAICTYVTSRYLDKYWPSDEWAHNMQVVRKFFDRQMVTGKGESDLGGRGIYTYFECALIPALLWRDRRLLESGAARHWAELCLMHCDNTGFMPDSGQSSYISYPIYTLQKSASLLGDGSLLATMSRREEAEKTLGFTDTTAEFTAGQAWDVGIRPRPMHRMVGVYHLPLTQWEWEVRGRSIPIEKSFDKLTMRTGFERDDQYLLLDGLHGGPAGKPWPDINSIVNFGQFGRTFLVTGIDGENAVNHNVVSVSRRGMGGEADTVASLEATADLKTFGYTHSRAEKYVYTSWDRHIFWRKGGWFVVLDALRAREPGDYSFECQWRTIGEPDFPDGDFTSTVWDQADDDASRDVFTIRNAEKQPLLFSEQRIGMFGGPETKRWESYSSRTCINRTRQSVERSMAVGDEQVFTNLFYVGGDRTRANHQISKLNDHVAILSGDELAYIGLADDGNFSHGAFSVDASAFCISESAVAAVNCTRIDIAGTVISAPRPCNIEYDYHTGRVVCETSSSLVFSAFGEDHHAPEGRSEHTGIPLASEQIDAFRGLITRDAEQSEAVSRPIERAQKMRNIQSEWRTHVGAGILAVHTGDIDGDGVEEVLVGLADGRVTCLDASGATRWEVKTGGPVRAVSHAELASGPAVLIGSDDEHVYAMCSDGAGPIWAHKCSIQHTYEWWTADGKAALQAIICDDIDDDGEIEIICGTGGGGLEVLSNDGKLKWSLLMQWGFPDRFAIVPAPEGGKMLLVSNSRASSTSATWAVSPTGEIISTNALDCDRTSWDMGAAPGLVVSDMDGDGRLEAIIARSGAYNELALYDVASGEKKWMRVLADRPTAVCAADVNGDGIAEVICGSASRWLGAYGMAGEEVFGLSMPHEIAAVAEFGGALYVACMNRTVYRVDGTGEVNAAMSIEGLPLEQFAIAGGHVLIADDSGNLTAIAPG